MINTNTNWESETIHPYSNVLSVFFLTSVNEKLEANIYLIYRLSTNIQHDNLTWMNCFPNPKWIKSLNASKETKKRYNSNVKQWSLVNLKYITNSIAHIIKCVWTCKNCPTIYKFHFKYLHIIFLVFLFF